MSNHGARTVEAALRDKFEQAGSVWLFDRGEDMPLSEADGERLSTKEHDFIRVALAAASDRTAGPHDQDDSHDEELLKDADAFAEKLKGKTGWRIVVGLAEKVRDLRFALKATNYLDHVRPVSPGKGEGWREIESAPKDGHTEVWVYDRHSGIMHQAVWKDRVGCFANGGWYDMPFTGDGRRLAHVTHWQPLPSPPISSRPEDSTVLPP